MNGVVLLPPGFAASVLNMATSAPAATKAAPGRRVVTPIGELAVREAGSGSTPLLLWRGLYAEASMFDPLVKELAPDYRLFFDQRARSWRKRPAGLAAHERCQRCGRDRGA